nr:hypothetical protein [uncultured Lachnoanaerobaculum sp.]
MVHKVIIKQKDKKIKKNSIAQYIGQEGVWALYGRKKAEDIWECLNVGKCKDVGKEILYDLGCLNYVPFRNDGTKPYINQFKNECDFKYKKGQVQEYLYSYIAKEYFELKFIYIHNKSDLKVEKEYAEKNKAIFWRNGHPYEPTT